MAQVAPEFSSHFFIPESSPDSLKEFDLRICLCPTKHVASTFAERLSDQPATPKTTPLQGTLVKFPFKRHPKGGPCMSPSSTTKSTNAPGAPSSHPPNSSSNGSPEQPRSCPSALEGCGRAGAVEADVWASLFVVPDGTTRLVMLKPPRKLRNLVSKVHPCTWPGLFFLEVLM